MTRLAEFRKRAGLTQKQVAQAASCSEQLITAIETGRRRLPNVYIAQRIARAVGVPVHVLFPPDEEPREEERPSA
ncbi:helix-turn-helix transcriptional regulator [Symbiobacterium terraclitae]|uniref:helix-turn-helix transcriptional regulator n=1 Tax=Symbiobacterium terraclitae TaxID=557451 RepID=UPI0035B4FF85